MKLVCLNIIRIFMMGAAIAMPFVLVGSVNAQYQNTSPSMVINMSDLSIRIGNTTSNETITFSNSTSGETGNSTD